MKPIETNLKLIAKADKLFCHSLVSYSALLLLLDFIMKHSDNLILMKAIADKLKKEEASINKLKFKFPDKWEGFTKQIFLEDRLIKLSLGEFVDILETIKEKLPF